MSNEHGRKDLEQLIEQQLEDLKATKTWEIERINPLGQEPENPQRTEEWDNDKGPAKK